MVINHLRSSWDDPPRSSYHPDERCEKNQTHPNSSLQAPSLVLFASSAMMRVKLVQCTAGGAEIERQERKG